MKKRREDDDDGEYKGDRRSFEQLLIRQRAQRTAYNVKVWEIRERTIRRTASTLKNNREQLCHTGVLRTVAVDTVITQRHVE